LSTAWCSQIGDYPVSWGTFQFRVPSGRELVGNVDYLVCPRVLFTSASRYIGKQEARVGAEIATSDRLQVAIGGREALLDGLDGSASTAMSL
jgi:hypothetical protein